MVLKTISSFSRYSSTKTNASHSFFDPSYIKQHKVTVVDGLLGTGSKQSSTANPHPSISTSSNFIVFDPSFLQNNNNNNNSNDNDNKSPRILLKKSSHKVNKNGHVSLSVESISGQFATLNLRRTNATTATTIKINKDDFISANYKPKISSSVPNQFANQISDLPLEKSLHDEPTDVKAQIDSGNFTKQQVDSDDVLNNDEFLKVNYQLMEKFALQNKNNEIMALYGNLKNRNIKLNSNIYNVVLQSIPLRSHVKETVEDNMTLLLNVYSDMITNGVKPNLQIYQNVISPLLSATIKSYIAKDLDQAKQYFKIANELFNVSLNSSYEYSAEIYEKLLVCYNLMKFTGVHVRTLSKVMLDRLGHHNILYYLGLMNLCKHSKDPKFALELYTQFKSISQSYPHLLQHQLQVYSSLIRTLVSCNQIDSAASILDQLIINIRSESGLSSDILPLLSSFVVSIAEIGLIEDLYLTLEKFDAISWLPKLSINSLMILVDKSCDFKEITYAVKFWEFAVVRKDFDFSVMHSNNNLVNLIANLSSVETKQTFAKLIEIAFIYGDKRNLVRLAKETLLKETLQIDIPLVIELSRFLFPNRYPNLAIKMISNQAYKLNLSTTVNDYLSSIVDVVPTQYYPELLSSLFFKTAIDHYSLIDDNIYGIHKVITTIWKSPLSKDEEFLRKLHYCHEMLFNELNDLNNFYVEIPQEIKEFKQILSSHLQ